MRRRIAHPIPSSVFADLSPDSESSTAPDDLTWDEWGPHHTRCFVDNGGHLSGTSGCRLFYSQKIVMDFNELDISRDPCRTGDLARLKSRELQMQTHDKDLAEAVTEVAAEVSGDPGRRIVLQSSVIRGISTKDVVTWLPYRVTEILCDQVTEVVVSTGEVAIAGTRDISSPALT